MIKLTKGVEPEILANNKDVWTAELLAAIEEGDKDEIKKKIKRYNHPQVKSALKLETSDKCAYCEAKVTDVAHGDIEHVTPKSTDYSLSFDWRNLTFSCQICNQKKSNKTEILDPYEVEPQDHLFFAGSIVKGKSANGTRTVLELDLNRPPLIEGRNREIERYANEIEKIHLLADTAVKTLILESLLADLETGKPEFIAACRTIIEAFRE